MYSKVIYQTVLLSWIFSVSISPEHTFFQCKVHLFPFSPADRTDISLWGLDTPVSVSAFCDKGDNICNFLYAFLHNKSLVNGPTLKGKNLLPRGSKFFPFRVDPFWEGRENYLTELPHLRVYLFSLNRLIIYRVEGSFEYNYDTKWFE